MTENTKSPAGSATGSDLAPCPFCGDAERQHVQTQGNRGRMYIACQKCGAQGPYVSMHDAEDVVAARWNRRATPQHSVTEQVIYVYGVDGTFIRKGTQFDYAAPGEYVPSHAALATPASTAQSEQWQARRYCKGDDEWTAWANISTAEYARRKGDASFEFRRVPASTAPSEHETEPVAQVDEGDDGLFVEILYGDNGSPLKRGDKLYLTTRIPACTAASEQQASVSEAPGAHHLTPESIAATIKDLREIEDGTTERPVIDRDWRTWAGVLVRVIEHLSGRATIPSEADERHALKVKVRGGRVWLVNHCQSFELGYVGDAAALEEYAGHLRAALTHRATTAKAEPIARVARIFGAERAEIMGYCPGALQVNMPLFAAAPDTATTAEQQTDPMDWPLPCDVTVGPGTHKAGTKLSVLVDRMRRLHELATGQVPHARIPAATTASASIRSDVEFRRLVENWSGAAHSFDEYTRTIRAKQAWNTLVSYIDSRAPSRDESEGAAQGDVARDAAKGGAQ